MVYLIYNWPDDVRQYIIVNTQYLPPTFQSVFVLP